MKPVISIQLKKQYENKNQNERGVLESSQSVSYEDQALTYPNHVSTPSESSLPVLHKLPTEINMKSMTPMLPRIDAASPVEHDDFSLPQRLITCTREESLAQVDESLSQVVRQMHHEEAIVNHEQNDYESGSPCEFTTGTQTDNMCESSVEHEQHELLSLHSERDTDEEPDDFYIPMGQKSQISFQQKFIGGLGHQKSALNISRKGSLTLDKLGNLEKSFAGDDDNFMTATSPLKDNAAEEKIMKDDPKKGFVYYIVHTALLSANLYAQQQLFVHAPQLAIMQLTFMRGVVCSIMVLLMINKNMKSVMWDSVDRSSIGGIAFRSIQGAISVYISFMSLNYFTVSTVGIVCALKPIIACAIGVLLLGERMGCYDVMSMSLILGAVLLVIFGTNSDSASGGAMEANTGAFIALIAQPFLLAGGESILRRLRKMPEQVCSAYQNLALALLASIYMFATGLTFSFVWELSTGAWLYLVLSCALTVVSQLVKAMAYKYCETAPLQKLSFLPNVWQFFIDLIILSVAFSTMQIAGFSLLIVFYIGECSWGIISSRIQDRKKRTAEAANDDGYTVV